MEKIKEKEAQLKEDKVRNLNEKHLLNSKRKELEEFYEEEQKKIKNSKTNIDKSVLTQIILEAGACNKGFF